MPHCTIKNTGDMPLCICDPDTGEVYCVLPGYTVKAKTEWGDVKAALARQRAQVVSIDTGQSKEPLVVPEK